MAVAAMELKDLRSVSTAVNVLCFIIVLALSTWLKLDPPHPVARGFFCDDKSIRYSLGRETISDNAVLLVSFFPAFFLLVGLELTYGIMASRRRAREEYSAPEDKSLLEFVKSGLCGACVLTICLMYGNALAFSVCEVTKSAFGTLRPAFLDVCQPETDVTSNCSGQFIQKVVCTNSDARKVLELRRSFPSGHASFSAFNMVFIMLYLQHRLPTSSPWLLKSLLQSLALLFAVFVSATRVFDNYHHPWDIVGGVVNGTAFALLTVYKLCPRYVRHPPRQDADTPLPLITKPSVSHRLPASTTLKEKSASPLD